MGDIALRVEGLSKQYRIGKREAPYRTFRDVLADSLSAPFRRIGSLLRGNAAAANDLNETIWALRDVTFTVKKGEVVGIIGRNGAGKSTLLKILASITEPTTGEVQLYGRVGALLEVGTGFHPELTGRENIYLNGAILGMSREEIRRKFDEIVAFAEVEKFIDTPVKHYSSGMGLRLGFAVAAHLEPEILIVDEVLAVGDAAFQKKCLGKMSEVAGEGRTVLFVSHNMAAVNTFCDRGILLDSGSILVEGKIADVVGQYLRLGTHSTLERHFEPSEHKAAFFEYVRIISNEHEVLRTGNDLTVDVGILARSSIRSAVVCLVIWDLYNVRLIDANTGMKGYYVDIPAGSRKRFIFTLKNVLLKHGCYRLELWLGIEHQTTIDWQPEAMFFDLQPDVTSMIGTVDYPAVYRCEFDIEAC
jgi:lipopolysaccharide transport system ATP-binding protein